MVVVTTDDESFRSLATDIAADRNREVMTSFDAVDGADEVLYVCPGASLHETALLRLQEWSLAGSGHRPFGVITGYTAAHARDLYSRRPGAGGRHGIVLRTESRDVHSNDDDATVLTREGATVEAFADRIADWSSLSMLTNGRTIHAFLTDGYLCGFPTGPDPAEFDGPHPYCVSDGEMDCPLPGDVVHAEELAVDFVFLNSCASMVPGNNMGGTGLPVHVGMGLLSGATSLVGGYRPYDGTNQEVALHYCLLRAGYGASERCYVLNRNAHATNLKRYPYATFGRPEVALPDTTEGRYDLELEPDGDDCLVRLHGVDAHVVDETIPGAAFEPGDGPYYLRNLTAAHADAPIFYTAFEEGDAVRLLVYTWGRLTVDELEFALSADQRRGRDLDLLCDCERNASGLADIGFLDRKARGQLKDLRNQLAGLPDSIRDQRRNANGYRAVDARFDRALESVERIRDRIRSKLDGRGPGFISEEYEGRTVETAVSVHDEDCDRCGRPVFVKERTSVFGRTARLRGICPKCLTVFDVPKPDSGTISYPRFDGDSHFAEPPRETAFELSFSNNEDVPMVGRFHPWLHSDRDDVRGKDVFEVDRPEVELEPGETASVAVTMDLADLPAGKEYALHAFVVANLEFYLAVEMMTLGRY